MCIVLGDARLVVVQLKSLGKVETKILSDKLVVQNPGIGKVVDCWNDVGLGILTLFSLRGGWNPDDWAQLRPQVSGEVEVIGDE